MPKYGRPRGRKWRVELTEAEAKLLRRHKSIARGSKKRLCDGLVRRIDILLRADESDPGKRVMTNAEIAAKTGVSETTVTNVCRDFCERGVVSALGYRRGEGSDTARLKATGEVEAAILAKACSPPPQGRCRWTLTLLEEAMAVVLEEWSPSRSTIGRVLRRNELRPHVSEYWVIPPGESAEFVAAMEDTLDIYQLPEDPARPVWCMDEKPVQLLASAREDLPARPGDTRKVDDEYVRDGTCCVFAFCRPLTGDIFHSVDPTRTAVDWANKVKHLVDVVEPDAERIVLVCDNLNVHDVSSLYAAFPAEEARRIARRIEIHHTPKHGSWLDIAEIAINIMTRQCLDRRIGSIGELELELAAWQELYDASPTPVDWRFTTPDGRIKLKRLYPDFQRNVRENDERRERKLEKLEELRKSAERRQAAASGDEAAEPAQ